MNLDCARRSQIDLNEEHHSRIGKSDEEGRFGKVAVSPNSQNLTERGIHAIGDPNGLFMDISVVNRQKDLKLSVRRTKVLVRAVLDAENIECSEVSVYFVSEKRISELHGEFFNDPTPTDCITFPIDHETLGEIFVCPKAAIDYCRKKGGDPLTETALYIVHGILHLLGYDDLDPKKRRAMRKKEKKCMAHLKDLMISL